MKMVISGKVISTENRRAKTSVVGRLYRVEVGHIKGDMAEVNLLREHKDAEWDLDRAFSCYPRHVVMTQRQLDKLLALCKSQGIETNLDILL